MTATEGWTPPDRPGDMPPPSAVPPPAGAYPAVPVQFHPGWHPHGAQPPLPGVPLAEIWQRLLAYVIDQAVFSAVSSVLIIPVWLLMFFQMRDSLTDPSGSRRPGELPELPSELLVLYGVLIGATFVLLFVYQSVSVAVWGGTVGKKAMKLRIVRVSDGGEVGWGRAMGRAGATVLLSLIPCVGWLNPAWALWDKPNRQALHDKLAGTVVIRTDYAPVGPRAEFTG